MADDILSYTWCQPTLGASKISLQAHPKFIFQAVLEWENESMIMEETIMIMGQIPDTVHIKLSNWQENYRSRNAHYR